MHGILRLAAMVASIIAFSLVTAPPAQAFGGLSRQAAKAAQRSGPSVGSAVKQRKSAPMISRRLRGK